MKVVKEYIFVVLPTIFGMLTAIGSLWFPDAIIEDYTKIFLSSSVALLGLVISLSMAWFKSYTKSKSKLAKYEKKINELETNRNGLIQSNNKFENEIEYMNQEVNRIYIQWIHLGQLLAGAMVNQKSTKFQVLYTSYITCSNILNIDIRKYMGDYNENVQNSEDS